MKNVDKDLINVEKDLEKVKIKQKSLILNRANLQNTPDTWTKGSATILNEVSHLEDEYWAVAENIKETMKDAWISKLWRVQNRSL